MKHKSKEELKAFRKLMDVQRVKDLVKADDFKEATDLCIQRNITSQEFAIIANNTDKDTRDILKLLNNL